MIDNDSTVTTSLVSSETSFEENITRQIRDDIDIVEKTVNRVRGKQIDSARGSRKISIC